jgi:hypothetical protein
MRKQCLCRLLPALAVLALAAAPLAAQDIPKGPDTWATPGGGSTWIELNPADWEAICNVRKDFTLQVTFKGIKLDGEGDGSVVVTRNENAVFDSSGLAQVPVQVTTLQFQSEQTNTTPCGDLDFQVHLEGAQQVAQMEIRRDSSAGGYFFVDLPVDAVVEGFDHATGKLVGETEKSGLLKEPSGGTPWSYEPPAYPLDPNAPWFPGVTTTGERVTIVRNHAEILAQHAYRPVILCPKVNAADTTRTKARTGVVAQPALCPQPADPVPVGTE